MRIIERKWIEADKDYVEIAGTQQDVVVQWPRPGDGKMLSDEFAILVSKTA